MVKPKLKKQIPDPRLAQAPPQPSAPPLELALEDDEVAAHRHGPGAKIKGGYDPYDRDPSAKKKPEKVHQRTDLRKLSEWIRLKREVEELKQQDEASAETPKK